MTIINIPNQIIKTSLVPLNLSRVTGVALHHMDNPTWGVKDVEAYHVNKNGWIAIGYNYWIAFDGTIYKGRGLNQGAHITGFNDKVIGIGFQGNFHSGTSIPLSTMTDAQFNSGVDLIEFLKGKAPMIRKVGGHRDFAASACPGNTFPLDEMVSGVKRGGKTMETHWAQEYYDYLLSRGISISETRFDDTITRGEVFKLLALVAGLKS